MVANGYSRTLRGLCTQKPLTELRRYCFNMVNPLIPTPVVDKNGRLTTVHKRAFRNSNGGKFPDPSSQSPYTVTEVDLGEFGKLISSDQTRDAWVKMPLVDQAVLSEVLALTKDNQHWTQIVSMDINLILMARKSAPYIEARMRRILAIAPLVDELALMENYSVRDLHRHMSAAFVIQTKFHTDNGAGSIEDWNADSDTKALGCMIAMAANTNNILNNGFHKGAFFEDDTIWLGVHSEELVPLMPLLMERGIYTRADIEPLLESPAPVLIEGIL